MKFFYKIIILLLIINVCFIVWQTYVLKASDVEHFADEEEEDEEGDEEEDDDEEEEDDEEDDGQDKSLEEIEEVEDEETKKLKDELYGKAAQREEMKNRLFKQMYEEHIDQIKPFKGFNQELKIVKEKCTNEGLNERFNRQDKVFSNFTYCDTVNKKPSFSKVITYLDDPVMNSHNYNQFDDYYAPYEIGKPVYNLVKPVPKSWNFSFRQQEKEKDYKMETPEDDYIKQNEDQLEEEKEEEEEEEEEIENETDPVEKRRKQEELDEKREKRIKEEERRQKIKDEIQKKAERERVEVLDKGTK